ncbi:hypothetical protein PILCRDRAFT_333869 [Piloderma croceum F 1598]|uniref:Uncharacterized protein n=1 Tax=Piloderma croceum (strain F 1598) TaxID=765440 RepID=A0A0C3FPQ0_PILCF|nr:hypothetical protein PILCRDRAFT_333869 [Piloderma croceum F 1598]
MLLRANCYSWADNITPIHNSSLPRIPTLALFPPCARYPRVDTALTLTPAHSACKVLYERRVKVYSSLLENYLSLVLEGLSGALSVSVEFADNELACFRISGPLCAYIDKVHEI